MTHTHTQWVNTPPPGKLSGVNCGHKWVMVIRHQHPTHTHPHTHFPTGWVPETHFLVTRLTRRLGHGCPKKKAVLASSFWRWHTAWLGLSSHKSSGLLTSPPPGLRWPTPDCHWSWCEVAAAALFAFQSFGIDSWNFRGAGQGASFGGGEWVHGGKGVVVGWGHVDEQEVNNHPLLFNTWEFD